jgi:mevalonate kinase
MKRKFPAKVLLFGEHIILRGSRALAIPLWARYGKWKQGGSPEQQGDLAAFAEYLNQEFPQAFATEKMLQDLAAGLYLASNVPVGYGLGSSGAVCVAVFRTYATAQGHEQLQQAGEKAFFARMESFFHGTSSGTDPLLIYLEKPLQLFPDGTWQEEQIIPLPAGWQLFLLDTKQARKTAPLVNYFTQRFDQEEDFRTAVRQHWMQPNDQAIDALLNDKPSALWQHFRTISQFQLEALPPMVLPSIKDVWQQGLASDHYALKICGAGGGGFCLGISKDWNRTKVALGEWELVEV